MDKNNKKVNKPKDAPSVFGPKAFDEIPDGLYDMGSIYRSKPRSREEELRERDEKRRAVEMQAIKEDIERRYSIQLETAQSGEASKPLLAEEGFDESIVKEELDYIDEIINAGASAIPTENNSSSENGDASPE